MSVGTELKLTLSADKTLITHANTGRARFLGYEIDVMEAPTKCTTPSTVQAVAACPTAPGGWGRGGAGGVAHIGHDAAGEGHPACLGLCGDPCPSHAVCDTGGTQTPQRVWPGRACGAAGGASALQGPRVVLDGNDCQGSEASAGGFQGGTVGRGDDRGRHRHMPDAKLCTSASSSHASVRRGPAM
jgi:hypothetical protein